MLLHALLSVKNWPSSHRYLAIPVTPKQRRHHQTSSRSKNVSSDNRLISGVLLFEQQQTFVVVPL